MCFSFALVLFSSVNIGGGEGWGCVWRGVVLLGLRGKVLLFMSQPPVDFWKPTPK